MAQKEEMKRLLLKGKIVGRKWTLFLDAASKYISAVEYNGSIICALLNDDSLVDIYSLDGDRWTFEITDHDSFEIGIKVGDEWWFEGDIGRDKGKRRFELIYDGVVFKMKYSFTAHEAIIRTVDTIEMLVDCERIGGIHDNQEVDR